MPGGILLMIHVCGNNCIFPVCWAQLYTSLQETWARSLGWEDPLEKGKYSTISTPVYSTPSMDGGAWQATIHGVAKSWTRPSNFTSLHFIHTPLQYSDLENSLDCIVHGVTKCRTGLSDFRFHHTVRSNLVILLFNLLLYVLVFSS